MAVQMKESIKYLLKQVMKMLLFHLGLKTFCVIHISLPFELTPTLEVKFFKEPFG